MMDFSAPVLPSAQTQEANRSQEQRTTELRIVFIALIPAAVIAVILRLVSRRVARMRIWWDDYMTLVALAFAIGLNVALLLGTFHGMGQHVEFAGVDGVIYNGKARRGGHPSEKDLVLTSFQVEFFGEIIYMIAMATIKISVLLFYYRLFHSDQQFKIAVWVMATVVMCWYLTSTLVAIFQCSPIPYNWDRTIPSGQCIRVDALWIGNSVSSLATDFAILCLPLPIVWAMDVTPRQKIAISAMFLLGTCVCITSILRLFTIHQLSDSDPTWTNVASAIWTSVECSTAVICGCLPTYKPLFRGLLGTVRKTRRDSITSLSPLSMTGDLRKASLHSILRKFSDYSITSPKQPHQEYFRTAANEKRMENFGKMPHFEEIEYSPNGRTSRAEMRGANRTKGMTELSPGQNSDQWNKWASPGVESVRLSDHVVSGSEDVPGLYKRDWDA